MLKSYDMPNGLRLQFEEGTEPEGAVEHRAPAEEPVKKAAEPEEKAAAAPKNKAATPKNKKAPAKKSK